MLTLLFVVIFTVCGLFLADWLLSWQPLLRRIWLGLVMGLFLWTWLPSLVSFVLGFTLLSNLVALGIALALLGVAVLCNKKRFAVTGVRGDTVRNLLLLLPLLVIGCYLFHTHILLPVDGGYYVGQTTFGDLPMHLGFISSIAKQGVFPPEYSIFPGHTVNYPFLCETSSASLVVLGSSLRTAYLIPAVYAFVLVVLGVYFFFEQWLKRRNRALLATFLFFVGGGFGFWYFLDLAGNGYSLLSAATNTNASSSLQILLDGFYHTPTNLPALGLRWVNPIVDMLIPQRATLFGWAFLFPCLYLLYGFVFRREGRNIWVLAVLAGGLPLIHTHSYVALAIISAGYCVSDLVSSFQKKRLYQWLLYGGVACVLGILQFVPFAFAQAAESDMLRFHFNWCNSADSYLWFYLKNLGCIAILTPVAFLALSRRTRRICIGPLLLWAISECVVFQPNTYDNNKLLFVCFAFACGLVAQFLCTMWRRANRSLMRRYPLASQHRSLAVGAFVLFAVLFAVMLFAVVRGGGGASLGVGTIGTMLLLSLTSSALLGYRVLYDTPRRSRMAGVQIVLCATAAFALLIMLLQQYRSATIQLPRLCSLPLLLAYFLCLAISALELVRAPEPGARTAWMRLVLQTGVCALAVCLFLSGVMTIAREMKSRYLAFNPAQVAAAEFVDENLETDAVFLTVNSWHLNPVPVLTGRSIVCGPGLYLFYHGIDTTERQLDVQAMFESPASSQALFEEYDVSYVYIGGTEKGKFAIDTAFFDEMCELVYDRDGIRIYRLD